ncbi:MAG: metallophosphoesterase family protein [Bacteroidota bacterium]|nr:metallophosphoesterase family protein [Bacteroidota bacterium]MDP4274496.1 metallophosphoesterase family protein [Bacteroidota bacterium]
MKKNIDRRAFIKGTSLAGLAGILTTSAAANAIGIPHGSSVLNSRLGEEMDHSRKLSYNQNGKFKIVQFTDTHYISGDSRSVRALKNVNEILDIEKPDLVIHTGDVIFGKPAEASIREILDPISKRGIPFAVTFGNHDEEFDKSRKELYQILKSIPYNISSTTEGISGVTNYILTLGSTGKKTIDRVLYLFDSNSYSKIKGIKGYDYIHNDQISWYRKQSMEFTRKNEGQPVPSLAFFHIPLLEHKEAAHNDGVVLSGTRGEATSSSNLNSGLFVSMKEMGDVHAIFLGHDHDNDYSLYWNDVFFIYGRYSGCDTVYNNLKPNGARVIELAEGEKGFRSWIRLSGGSIIQDMRYPDDFMKK